MTIYFKRTFLNAIFFISIVPLINCSQTPEKSQGANPIEGNELAYKTFDAETIGEQQYNLMEFGPDPFIQNAPIVQKDIKKRFDDVMKDISNDDIPIAEDKLKRLVDEFPYYSGPAYNLAVIKFQQEDLDSAIKYLRMSLERNYYNQKARNLYALINRKKGNFKEAEKLWKENLSIWGGHAPSYLNLGILYDLYMGTPEKAVGYYKQFNQLQSKPKKYVQGWVVSIDRLIAQKKKREAIQQAEVSSQNVNNDTQNEPSINQVQSGSIQ